MKILTTMICAIAVVALFGCGGSSYLSESPGEGDVSSLAFTVEGVVSPRDGTSATKDIVLSHVTGDANTNSGDSSLDAGAHACSFSVTSSDPLVVGVDDGDTQTCADSLNCAVCTLVDGDPASAPDCSISCVVNAVPRPALVGMTLDIVYNDYILFYTDAVGSSGGAIRIDGIAAPSGSHLFDGTSVAYTEELPCDDGMSYDGIKIVTGASCPGGPADLFTADVSDTDSFTRIYNISDTEQDPDGNLYFGFGHLFDGYLSPNDAWAGISVDVDGSIDLSNLAVPDTSETYDGGYMSTNAGMWHDSANQASTF